MEKEIEKEETKQNLSHPSKIVQNTTQSKKKKISIFWIYVALCLVVVAVLAFGGYYYAGNLVWNY